MGHINVLRDLDRLATTWPSLDKLVVSGSSAGGYGALINYGDARLRWPAASTRSYLIDDSGPPLENAHRNLLLTEWYLTWGLLDWTEGLCVACIDDVSQLIPNVAQRYPDDRMSLLESEEDGTIGEFYILDGSEFSLAITQLATDRIAPNGNFRSFYIPGPTHTMLGDPDRYKSGSTTLTTFIAQQIGDDAAWKSLAP